MDDNDSIEIRDESTHEERRFHLLIGGYPRALLKKRNRTVELVWEVYGPQYWPKARVLMQGLLELSVLADQLSGEV